MRLPETKIMEGLLHPSGVVRQAALDYFTDGWSRNPEIMPLVIRNIESLGWADAFSKHFDFDRLAQTEETVDWILRSFHGLPWNADLPKIDWQSHLLDIFWEVPSALLLPRAEEIRRLPDLHDSLRTKLDHCLRLATLDADGCRKELEEYMQLGVDGSPDYTFDKARPIARSLGSKAAGRKDLADWVVRKLAIEANQDDTIAQDWEILLVEIAGEMRLETAVPGIVAKMLLLGDLLSECGVLALAKIGTDAAVAGVTENWPKTKWDYRLYATTTLECLHRDATVRRCLELYPQENFDDIRARLVYALVSQYCEEGIEPARAMIIEECYEADEMRDRLVASAVLLGRTFPELEAWHEQAEEGEKEFKKGLKGLPGEFSLEEIENAFRKMQSMIGRGNAAPPAKDPDPEPQPRLQPFLRTEKPTGRNDPCPCGSGKKFKKCCLGKHKNFLEM